MILDFFPVTLSIYKVWNEPQTSSLFSFVHSNEGNNISSTQALQLSNGDLIYSDLPSGSVLPEASVTMASHLSFSFFLPHFPELHNSFISTRKKEAQGFFPPQTYNSSIQWVIKKESELAWLTWQP